MTPLVERTPRLDRWGETVERQLFSHHVKDAYLGYAPMWLNHLDLMLRQRPCQVAWVQVPGVGVGT